MGWLKAKIWGQNTVVELSLFDLMKAYREGTLNTKAYMRIRDGYVTDISKHAKKLEEFALADLIKVNQLCLNADTIFLCVHGKYNDNGRGFAHLELDNGNAPVTAVTDWKSLAGFLNVLLPARSTIYNLALIMCYAPRTERFRLDQQGQVDSNEVKTSFAYKLFASVCQRRPLRMTARTGAVGFNPDTGHFSVETGEAVLARADRDEIDHERETAEVYRQIKARMTTKVGGASEESVQKWLALRGAQVTSVELKGENIVTKHFVEKGGVQIKIEVPRRAARVRSIPLSSAPNSCAVISRRRSCAPSPSGTAYVPSSRRLLHSANPSRSQYSVIRLAMMSIRIPVDMTRLFVSVILVASFCAISAAQAPRLLEQADEAFRQGDHARAETLARQVLASAPNTVHAHMILGVIAASRNQWDASSSHFTAVTKLDPTNPHGYFYLGQAKLYQRQWEPAVRYFKAALERQYPGRDRLYVELALAQNEAGRPNEALETLARTPTPADPRLASQYFGVTAFAKAKLNDSTAAIESIRRAIELDDANPQLWEFLIDQLIQTDQAPRALAEAIRAQRKFPDHPDILFAFALASYHVTESPLSKLALRNLREADPTSPRTLLAEGLLHRKEGRNAEATAAFRKAAAGGVPDAHLLLGILLREAGDEAGAEKEYREAERINPNNGQVLLEIGKMLLARGDLNGAAARLKRAAGSMPSAPAVHYQLAIVYRRLNQTEDADRHFRLYQELRAGK